MKIDISAEKMLASKTGAFTNKKKRPCSDGHSSISDIWSLLSKDVASNLRKSVISLVLTDDYGYHTAFSGIAIECQNDVTKFVTTGALASTLCKRHYKSEIKVYCEGNVVEGHLDQCDISYQLAVVAVQSALDVCCVHLDLGMECKPCKQLIAVGRRFDSLITTSGEISYGSGDREFLIFPPVSENWLGAAFFDIKGKFVGMNHCIVLGSKIFLERSSSRNVFRYVGMNGWFETARGDCFHPMGGMILVHKFEDPFGDVYPNGLWGELRKRVSSEISRNVVALASFKGGKRIFACTGLFIVGDDKHPKILTSASLVRDPDDQNKIDSDLRIDVLLPGKRCEIGTLEIHSLQYNVAVVSVGNYRALCPVNLERLPVNLTNDMMHDCMANDTTVVAVGRIFNSGALMATSGKLSIGSGMLDCRALCYSTCKITKAGIGGPLVDVNGNFIGMNFHGLNYRCKKVGTPYLYREDISEILKFLKTKETRRFSWGDRVIGDEEPINTWPVPDPYWCDPSDVEDYINDKRELPAYGSRIRYRFGSMSILM